MKLILPSLLFCLTATASDWPTWRHDSQRTGSTADALPEKLSLQWTRALDHPDPAFDYHFRLCADQSYEPVSANGLLFVPSNVNDSVTVYDAVSGAQKWRFTTEGPVRFAPVVSNGLVYFGSDDGNMYCVNASSGALQWKTRGAPSDRADYRMLVNGRLCSRWPVRGGPVLDNGTLCFGCGVWPSEGVFLVALNPANGTVKWRNAEIAQIDDGLDEHGKMADMGLPPHGYLAAIGGRVAMPSGRALAAFADPVTGKLDPYNSYYAKVYPVPRGSWALCGNADFWFQGGAIMGTNPAMLENLPLGPLTVADFAKLAGKTTTWAEDMIQRKFVRTRDVMGQRMVLLDPRSPAVAIDTKVKDRPPGQLFQLAERPVLNMAQLGTRHEVGERGMPVFAANTMYRSEFRDPKGIEVERGATHVAIPKYDVLRAYRLDEAAWKLNILASKRAEPVQRNLEFPIAWEMEVPELTVKLLAGNRLYLAGANKIVAAQIPANSSEKPFIAWQEKVQGYPVGVIAANNQLIVTTDTGRLYAFGAAGEAKVLAPDKPAAWDRRSQWRAHVAKLKSGCQPAGNALVIGWNSGELAKELAVQTQLRVIVSEPDAAIAAQARESLVNAGAWARRIHLVSGTSEAMKLPPYFAEVILSETFQTLDDGARKWTRMALQALRPYTGIAMLPLRPKLIDQARTEANSMGGFEFETTPKWTTIRRTSAPKGADEWTHEAATGANTFASHDTLAVPPFGLLWYSGSIDREFSPAFEFHHNRNPYPTIAAGRMFMLAASELHAADVYTGRHLWKATVPESAKAARRLSDHRTFSRPTDQNLIATEDRIYVFRENDAQVFDSTTGKILGTLKPPSDTLWDEARIAGDALFIASGKTLFVLDRHTGDVRWRKEGTQEHLAFGLGEDRVFVVDYTSNRAQKPDQASAFETKISVFDAKNGDAFWSEKLMAAERPEQSDRGAGKPKWSGIFQDNPLKPSLHYNAYHNVVIAIVDRHEFHAFDAQSGSPLWQYDAGKRLTDLVTFEPPTVTNEFVICHDGTVLNIRTGKPSGPQAVGGRGTGCNRFVGSDALVTFRSALACFLDLETKERTYLASTRPGCTNSMIPAAGLLNAPNFAHGCVCNYPFLTSFSLFHMPEAAKWGPKNKPDVQVQTKPNAD